MVMCDCSREELEASVRKNCLNQLSGLIGNGISTSTLNQILHTGGSPMEILMRLSEAHAGLRIQSDEHQIPLPFHPSGTQDGEEHFWFPRPFSQELCLLGFFIGIFIEYFMDMLLYIFQLRFSDDITLVFS